MQFERRRVMVPSFTRASCLARDSADSASRMDSSICVSSPACCLKTSSSAMTSSSCICFTSASPFALPSSADSCSRRVSSSFEICESLSSRSFFRTCANSELLCACSFAERVSAAFWRIVSSSASIAALWLLIAESDSSLSASLWVREKICADTSLSDSASRASSALCSA